MELRDLRYFCLVAETGSVTRAADTLCVSQPFVTKVIHRLEEELGTKLFDLEKRRVVFRTANISTATRGRSSTSSTG